MRSTALESRLELLARKWDVLIEETSETPSSLLSFGTRDGEPVVLKIARTESEHGSGAILNAFRARGLVRVHDYVDDAVLLERALPGTLLAQLARDGRDDEATEILGALIDRMTGAMAPPGCPTVEDWGKSFDRYLTSRRDEIPRDLVEAAQRSYVDLSASQRVLRLLHGDLHHRNVLFDTNRGWLAIDPKGVIGEVEYEVGALLRNPVEHPELFTSQRVIERRVALLTRHLELDPVRMIGWAFAQSVLAAIWEVEDGIDVSPQHPFVRLARTLSGMK
jgi:streptomycin 6-kinase